MRNLPSDLSELLKSVDEGYEEYPSRRSDLDSINRWLENGDFDMARYTAQDIIKRQQQLRSARGGLPSDLQSLLQQLESEAEQYPDRPSDLELLNRWLKNGDFDMARHTATDIIKRQQQLRSAHGGLPSDLQSLFQQLESEAEQYPDRPSGLGLLSRWLKNGDFDMARYTATDIIKRQQQLRSARSGLPSDLQSLLQQLESEAEEYPNRPSDLEMLNRWLKNGDFDMARYTATDIIKRQKQLRSARSALSSNPQSLLQQVKSEVEQSPLSYSSSDKSVGMGPSIFLAHSSADKSLVRSFHRILKIDGFRPWFDEANLVVGQNWSLEIEKAVRRSNTIAVFLSKRSVDGRGYVHKELTLALDIAESEPEGSIFILPIRLDDVAMPARLGRLHYLDYRDKLRGIGGVYVGLQRGLISRAHQLDEETVPYFDGQGVGLPSSGPKTGIRLGEEVRVSWPRVSYLVHGYTPANEEYVGTAALQVVGGSAVLTAEIGREVFRYSGQYSGGLLTFSGPHNIVYDARSSDGVLRGVWNETGFEELIPASPFARCTDGVKRSV